jgi:uncharacterized protein YdeI (YjbR/CyaY-like superfamily)
VRAGYPQVEIVSRAQWRQWLTDHHAAGSGVWVVTWKKGSAQHLPMDVIVDEALCFGWVDSLPRALDQERSQRLLTPRKPRSSWSRVNKRKVERLTAAGLMAPSGLAAVALAKENGAWSALDATEELTEPDDLRAALDAVPAARAQWDGFPRSAKRAILEWIGNAKTEATRGRRVAESVTEAALGRRANQWRQPGR